MRRLQLTFAGMVRWCACLAAALSIVGLLQAFSRPVTDRRCEATSPAEPCSSRGMRLPMLSLQLARDTYEVGRIAPSTEAREALLASIRHDYLVIPVYVALFVALGVLLGRDSPSLGALTIACVSMGAIVDVGENVATTFLLNTRVPTLPMVEIVNGISSVKWLLWFLAVASIAPLFLPREGILLKGVGAAFLGAAATGIYGLAVDRPFVEVAFLVVLGAITTIGVSMIVSPRALFAPAAE